MFELEGGFRGFGVYSPEPVNPADSSRFMSAVPTGSCSAYFAAIGSEVMCLDHHEWLASGHCSLPVEFVCHSNAITTLFFGPQA